MKPTATTRATLALIALVSAPAWAQTSVYPGTMCTFDGPVERQVTGALMNASSGSNSYSTTSKLHCPVPRTKSYAALDKLKVKVNVMLNNHLNNNPWVCVLRTTNAANAVIQTKSVELPGANYPTMNWTFSFDTIWLDAGSRSYNFRCNVPDKTGSFAGIISYEVTEGP